jgi:hypothetical protein
MPFENRMEALTGARQHKLRKCEGLAIASSLRFSEIRVDAIFLGSLGTWDPKNDYVLSTVSSESAECVLQASA